ncbi:chromosome segregation protein SMC [Pelagibius litoralis]|uniref:Chromosome partition protein Smc n=1 Tax=Pelagibius litoralis TaxID=374515 RepID=A0A967F215_9PROT|nr:chromosome segregation protein SMC [Pelagibius litoralis]
MQFTKLRLSGFKSFVDATELVIEPGMTGVVGPNGCGKSNLVEALRWAMGETSAKSMRGREMDDVIFAGSSDRPSRNVADVTLYLNNDERKAPAMFNDLEEIEVTRRIDRGSGSTYRVNGKEVRARDVQLLFADAATGAHSTALVSQGRIGALINAKPADRRSLLEEAAGITGLHSRRHEAELRLRAAETNLERLDDVIATLETQLQGLKKQARQATRYRNVNEHIRRSEAIVLHLEGMEAKEALATAEAAYAEAEKAVAEVTQTAASRASEQAEAAAALPTLRDAEAEAAAGLHRLTVDRDTLDREEAQAVEAKSRAEERLAQLLGDRSRAEGLAGDAQAAQQRLDSERKELTQAAEGESEDLAAAEAERAAASGKSQELEQTLSGVTNKIAQDEARAAALLRRIEELTQRLQRLRAQSQEARNQRQSLQNETVAEAELTAAGEGLEEAEQTLARNRQNSAASAEATAAARGREAESRGLLREKEAAQAKLEAEISALTALLEPAESDMWPPVVDAVSVTPGFEAALGAALGDDLTVSADEAAPVHWEALSPLSAVPALPAGADPLSAVVRGPAALDRRLSQIGVVADSATGARLQAELRPGQRLVTKEGDLWRWDGFTARAEAPTAAAQRMAQRNRLAELRSALEGVERETARAAADHGDLETAVEQAVQAEKAARETEAAAFDAVNTARQKHTALAQKANAVASRLAALDESLERLQGDERESEATLEQGRGEQAALPDLNLEHQRADELREALSEARDNLVERQGRLDQLRREAEARGRRLGDIATEYQSWLRRAEEAKAHLTDLEERRGATQTEIETLAAVPLALGERREALAALIEEAENRRRSAADALASGENRLGEADKTLKAEEARLTNARENRIRCEGAVSQGRQSLDTVIEKVREKLSCELDQALAVVEIDPEQSLPPREEVETKLARLIRERENLGAVNLRAEAEARELDEQIVGMQSERSDLIAAISRLRQGIASLNREGRERLLAAFEAVNSHFSELFVRLFGGGRAHLKLTESEDPLAAGLEIMASPPGKRLQVMSLLSGGEQALTALALLFGVFLTNPAPICVLDEVDAPLDDANVDRFCSLVHELTESTATRFLLITHHRMTMARVDRLFGVTMAERGISQLVSVDLQAAEGLRESA